MSACRGLQVSPRIFSRTGELEEEGSYATLRYDNSPFYSMGPCLGREEGAGGLDLTQGAGHTTSTGLCIE
jgi:hypothetical protein